VKVPVRTALLGAGFLALGLVQHPGAKGAGPFSPGTIDVPQDSRSIANGTLPIREPAPLDASRRLRSEDDAAADADVEDDAAVAGSRDYRWTATDVLYMRDRASARARCIIDREIGGFGYDPWRRGAEGERGPVQLHPRGLLPEYLVWSGGQAPENPYYAVPFLEYKLGQGQARQWSPVRLGLC